MQKHFSILICCYNCQAWIEKSMQSAIFQEYDNYEILIADAKSTDATFNIVGNNAITTALEAGIIKKHGVMKIGNVPVALGLF